MYPIGLYLLHTASRCLEVGLVPNSSIHIAYSLSFLEVGHVSNRSIPVAYSLSLFGGWACAQ